MIGRCFQSCLANRPDIVPLYPCCRADDLKGSKYETRYLLYLLCRADNFIEHGRTRRGGAYPTLSMEPDIVIYSILYAGPTISLSMGERGMASRILTPSMKPDIVLHSIH